jgi:hypothetical protein
VTARGTDGARRFMARGTSGKLTPGDRDGLRYLWSLLYRAVRREHTRVENALRSVASIARRLGAISTELTELRSRVERLERRCWGDRDARRTDP